MALAQLPDFYDGASQLTHWLNTVEYLLYGVRLDGKRVSHCVEADADEGWVEVYMRDDQCRIIRDPDASDYEPHGGCAMVRIYGKVEIKLNYGRLPAFLCVDHAHDPCED